MKPLQTDTYAEYALQLQTKEKQQNQQGKKHCDDKIHSSLTRALVRERKKPIKGSYRRREVTTFNGCTQYNVYELKKGSLLNLSSSYMNAIFRSLLAFFAQYLASAC